MVAARLIFDRIAPAPRSREIDLPALGNQNVGDALIATYARITQAVAGSSITPSEAVELIAIVARTAPPLKSSDPTGSIHHLR